ncbi:MAG: low molecular weight protein-tyrosine-phosphatase [Syntrophothermus sp.]
MKILFVCTGNICRSPLAEGIMRQKLKKYNLPGEVDSAGFEAFHIGDPPDARAVTTARKRNIDITDHEARLFQLSDFDDFDRIYVMDDYHFRNVMALSRNEKDKAKVDYMMNVVYPGQNIPVDDPWYHGIHAFEKVYEQLDHACEILVKELSAKKS